MKANPQKLLEDLSQIEVEVVRAHQIFEQELSRQEVSLQSARNKIQASINQQSAWISSAQTDLEYIRLELQKNQEALQKCRQALPELHTKIETSKQKLSDLTSKLLLLQKACEEERKRNSR